MSEMLDVLRAIDELGSRGQPMALATIVATSGSTYRGAGARLLVLEEGPSIGNLSGGCLEGDVESSAREVMVSGEPRLLDFDLTAEDEAIWGWGLGCNGAIEVLVEPADRAAEFAGALRRAIEEQRPLTAVTVLDSEVPGVGRGARLVTGPDGDVEGGLGDPDVDEAAVGAAMRALAAGRSSTEVLEVPTGRVRVFVEALLPPPRLLVCGAGHDAMPLVDSAAALGWHVLVVDDRRAMLDERRFPAASGFVHVDQPADAATAAGHDERTYVVVMTHNYLRDLDYLRSFLGTGVAYIGMLGPRRRLERLLGDLAGEGVRPTEADLATLHGPAGLDIGADGPDEIAAAIVAEITAVHRGRSGGFLRDRDGPIHDRRDASPAPLAP